MSTKTFTRNLAGASTYECGCCGRRTRDTGAGELGCELCAFCYEAAGIENSCQDGHITPAEAIEQFNQLKKQFNYDKRVHKDCITDTLTAIQQRQGVTLIETPAPDVIPAVITDETLNKVNAEIHTTGIVVEHTPKGNGIVALIRAMGTDLVVPPPSGVDLKVHASRVASAISHTKDLKGGGFSVQTDKEANVVRVSRVIREA